MPTPDPRRPDADPTSGARADPPPEGAGRPATEDQVRGALVSALGRIAHRLAEETVPGETGEPDPLPWGRHAAEHPPEYWHWLHLRERRRAEQVDLRDLPTSGPLISVVVPVYRPSHWYFRECVQSVVRQTYRDWELCLCDDGSGDPELTTMMEELAAGDPRIRVMAMAPNGGISRATNRAVEASSGVFVALLDHDDLLDPEALAELAAVVTSVDDADVVYTDEDKYDELDRPNQPHFKPGWSPDLLLAFPYLGHLTAIRRTLLDDIGGFRPEFDGSQDFDVMLRATERARRVVHIPRVLYHWRVVAGSAAGDSEAKPWAHAASRRVVEDALVRRGIDGSVDGGPFLGADTVRRRVRGTPSVSVIIPFRDQAALTAQCLDSLDRSPGYPIGEVVLVDNGSSEPETSALRLRLADRPATRVLDYPGPFNWSAINNQAAATCDSDMLLFLNNDIEASSEGWLEALVAQAQRPEVGAVGAHLLYPDGRLQHAGVVLGLGGPAGHLFAGLPANVMGYFGWERVTREVSAVTAACMLVRRPVFEELHGFDEAFAVGFNDVDFCIRLGQAGYRVIYTPQAELVHYESVSRGYSGFHRDYEEFLARWTEVLRAGDPFYNPNLGRLEPWCPLRAVGEDEQWLRLLGGLTRSGSTGGEPVDGGADTVAPVPDVRVLVNGVETAAGGESTGNVLRSGRDTTTVTVDQSRTDNPPV